MGVPKRSKLLEIVYNCVQKHEAIQAREKPRERKTLAAVKSDAREFIIQALHPLPNRPLTKTYMDWNQVQRAGCHGLAGKFRV